MHGAARHNPAPPDGHRRFLTGPEAAGAGPVPRAAAGPGWRRDLGCKVGVKAGAT